MYKKLIMATVLLFSGTVFALAEEMLVNGKAFQEDARVNLFKDEMQQGRIPLAFMPDADVQGIEVSIDGGHVWQAMAKTADIFAWDWRPLVDGQADIVFSLTGNDGGIRIYDPRIRVNYMTARPEESIKLVLDRLKDAYAAAQKERVLSVFAHDLPERTKFEEAIQKDFYYYTNIRLRYRLDRLVMAPDQASAVGDIFWEKRYSPRSTLVDAKAQGVITTEFVREGGQWLIRAMRSNTVFGSSLIVSRDLYLSSTDIVDAGGSMVRVVVHNNSDAEALNVKVRVLYKLATAPSDTDLLTDKVIARIAPNSSASTENISYPVSVGAPPYFRAIVDPDNAIIESNESNNQASKNF